MAAPALPSWASAYPVARLATVDGARPHIVPVVFCELEGRLYVPVDGKPKSGRPLRRLANIARNPAVSLLVDHYAADWSRLRWARADGQAAIGPTPPAAAAALRAKYPQYEHTDLGTECIRIEVHNVRTWQARPPSEEA